MNIDTLTQTLKASASFEKQARIMERATACLELSQRAYKRYLDYSDQAHREEVILSSTIGWRAHPFVSTQSHARLLYRAEISLMASQRLLKAYRYQIFKAFTNKPTI